MTGMDLLILTDPLVSQILGILALFILARNNPSAKIQMCGRLASQDTLGSPYAECPTTSQLGLKSRPLLNNLRTWLANMGPLETCRMIGATAYRLQTQKQAWHLNSKPETPLLHASPAITSEGLGGCCYSW